MRVPQTSRPTSRASRVDVVRARRGRGAYLELELPQQGFDPLAGIVLYPSREESFGRIAAEAMLNGIPVVASDILAYRELVGEPGAVLLFPVGDAAGAAAAIARLANDPGLRRELGGQGRAHVQRSTPDRIVPQFEAYYRGRR